MKGVLVVWFLNHSSPSCGEIGVSHGINVKIMHHSLLKHDSILAWLKTVNYNILAIYTCWSHQQLRFICTLSRIKGGAQASTMALEGGLGVPQHKPTIVLEWYRDPTWNRPTGKWTPMVWAIMRPLTLGGLCCGGSDLDKLSHIG